MPCRDTRASITGTTRISSSSRTTKALQIICAVPGSDKLSCPSHELRPHWTSLHQTAMWLVAMPRREYQIWQKSKSTGEAKGNWKRQEGTGGTEKEELWNTSSVKEFMLKKDEMKEKSFLSVPTFLWEAVWSRGIFVRWISDNRHRKWPGNQYKGRVFSQLVFLHNFRVCQT